MRVGAIEDWLAPVNDDRAPWTCISGKGARMVICPKCSAQNAPDQTHCSQCRAHLLPGRSILERLGYLGGGLAAAALVGGLAYLFSRMETAESLPDCCASPLYLAFLSLTSLIGGLVLALGRTPQYEKYVKRAQRHVQAAPEQALSDLNQALELAPVKRQPDVRRQRAAVYAKLGRKEEALADLSSYAASPDAHRGAKIASEIIGIELEDAARAVSPTEMSIHSLEDQLVQEGTLCAVGYCKRCREAAELDKERRCPKCGRQVKEVKFVKPPEREAEVAKLGVEAASRRKRRRIWMIVGGCALFACVICAGTTIWSAQKEGRVAGRTATPSPSVLPVTFAENVFSFEVPSDWNTMSEEDTVALLETALEGYSWQGHDYAGGVYSQGTDSCPGCAQIVVAVVRMQGMTGSLTTEQYQDIREAAQQQMGSRLVSQHRTEVGSLPAVESTYLDAERLARVRTLVIIPDEPGVVYLVTCCAHKDAFADFEAVFERALGSLEIEGAPATEPDVEVAGLSTATPQPTLPVVTPPPTQALPASPTPTPLPGGMVNVEALNVRAGPGTQYTKLGLLTKGEVIEVTARTAAGDWLAVSTDVVAHGWVSAAYVDLNIPVEQIPVAEEIPPTPTPSGPTPTPLPPVDAEIERLARGEHGELPPPAEVGGVAADGEAEVAIVNDTPYELTILVGAPSSTSITLEACATCRVYSMIGPIFCPKEGRPQVTARLKPGISQVAAKVSDPSVIPFLGSWDLKADTRYAKCFFIVTRIQ
jgi:hypothetical protein